MSTASASASPAPTAAKGRTRNAQAQADLRLRRKAYIKTLEDTVSSLEACVRQLRAQNAQLLSESKGGPSSSCRSGKDELGKLREENNRLYAMIAEAGLAAAAASKLAKMGKESENDTKESQADPISLRSSEKSDKGKRKDDEHCDAKERTWSSTSSITTKKRKVSKMQAFAKDVDSQLNAAASPQMQSSAEQSSLTASAVERTLDATLSGVGESSSRRMTPVSYTSRSSSSSRESVVSSLQSPTTPRFEAPIALPPTGVIQADADKYAAALPLGFNPVHSNTPILPHHDFEAPWSYPAAMPPLQTYFSTNFDPATATYNMLPTWLTTTQSATINQSTPTPASSFPWLDTHCSSASIRVA